MKYAPYVILVLFIALSGVTAFNSELEANHPVPALLNINNEANILDSILSWFGIIDLNKSSAVVDCNPNGVASCGYQHPTSGPSPICADVPAGWQPGQSTSQASGNQTCNTNSSAQGLICQHYLQCWSLGVTGNNGSTRTRDGRWCVEPYGNATPSSLAIYNACLREGGGAASGPIPTLRGGGGGGGSCEAPQANNYFPDTRNITPQQTAAWEAARNAYLSCIIRQEQNNTSATSTNLSGRVTDRNGNPINGVQLYNDNFMRETGNTTGGSAGACQAWPNTGSFTSSLPRNGRVVLGGANSGWCTEMAVYLGSAGSYPVQYDSSAQVFFIEMAAPPTALSDVGYISWGGQTSDYLFFGLEGATVYTCSWNGSENTFLDPRLSYYNRCDCPGGAQSCELDSNHLPPLSNSFKTPDTRKSFSFINTALAAVTDYLYRPGHGNLKIGASASDGQIVFDGEFINYLSDLSPAGSVNATNGNRILIFPDNLGRYFSDLVVRYEKGSYKTTKTFSLSGNEVNLSATLNIAGTTPPTTTITTTLPPSVNVPAPKISSFSPLVANPGDIVTVRGKNFIAGGCPAGLGAPDLSVSVRVGDQTIGAGEESAKILKFRVPEELALGAYKIQVVSGGCATKAGRASDYSTRLLSVVNSSSDPTVYYVVPSVFKAGRTYDATVYGTNLSDILSVTSESGDLDVDVDSISTTPFSSNKVKIKFRLSVSSSADHGLQYLTLEDDSGNSVRFNLVVGQ